jgi:hypothetical protein
MIYKLELLEFFKSMEIKDSIEFLKKNEEWCTPIYELCNNLVLYDIIMQTKEVIESVLKVSSLIIVLNGFEIVARKFCHI